MPVTTFEITVTILITNILLIKRIKVKVSRNRPRWPKGFRVD